MTKKLLLAFILLAGICSAAPRPPAPRPHPALIHHYGPRIPPPHRPHVHHHYDPFLSGLAGGFVGSVVGNLVVRPPAVVQTVPAVVTAPVAVVQPVVRQVWVEGRYIDQIQANGTVIRVWQPGHYETISQ